MKGERAGVVPETARAAFRRGCAQVRRVGDGRRAPAGEAAEAVLTYYEAHREEFAELTSRPVTTDSLADFDAWRRAAEGELDSWLAGLGWDRVGATGALAELVQARFRLRR